MPRHCVYITQAQADPVPAIVGDRQTRRAGNTLVVYGADQADAEALSAQIPGSTYGATIDLPGGTPGSAAEEY